MSAHPRHEADKPITNRLLAHGIGFSISHSAARIPSNGQGFRWHCALMWADKIMWEGEYFKGLGHAINAKRANGRPFKKAPGVSQDDLLESLYIDARSWEGNPIFEDFCRDFGYDTDSIKALKIHDGCRRAYIALRSIPHLYDLLNEVIGDL